MSPGTGRKIGRNHRDAIEFAPGRVRLSKPERSQRNDENAYPFRSVQCPAWEKTFRRNIGRPATDTERLPGRFLAHLPDESIVIKMEQRRRRHHTGENGFD